MAQLARDTPCPAAVSITILTVSKNMTQKIIMMPFLNNEQFLNNVKVLASLS